MTQNLNKLLDAYLRDHRIEGSTEATLKHNPKKSLIFLEFLDSRGHTKDVKHVAFTRVVSHLEDLYLRDLGSSKHPDQAAIPASLVGPDVLIDVDQIPTLPNRLTLDIPSGDEFINDADVEHSTKGLIPAMSKDARAASGSYIRWRFSRNSGLVPGAFPILNAVSSVIAFPSLLKSVDVFGRVSGRGSLAVSIRPGQKDVLLPDDDVGAVDQ